MGDDKRFGPVRFVPGANGGRYPNTNSVYVEGAGVLIDAGADRLSYAALRAGAGVREVWLTHWHEDHIAYLDLFDDLPLRQMSIEAEPLSDLETFLDWYGIAEPDYRAYWRMQLTEAFNFRPRKATSYFRPGEVIDVGSCSVEIVHTPGHTPGHAAFYFREPQVVFMGDYDLTRFGPWYGDRDSDIDELIASCQRLRALPARVWLTSHEDGCFEGDTNALFDRYLGVIDERENALLDYLSAPRTMDDIAARHIVYRKPREPKAFFDWGERAIMGKHLQRLMRRRVVVVEDGRYRRIA